MRHGYLAFALPLLFFIAGSALGQPRPTARLNAVATIQGVGPRMLLVTTEGGENWRVTVPSRAEQIVYQGSASPGWLQPGMIVRFFAKLPRDNKRLLAQGAVGEVTVVTLRPGIEAGVFPAPDENERQGGQELSHVESERGQEKVAKKKQRARKAPLPAVRCLVIGCLLEIKANKIEVAAGRVPVTAEITDALKVSVEVNDYRLSREGDKVELSARYWPGRKGLAEGEQMSITAAKPLVVASKRSARSDRVKKTGRARKD